MKLKSSSTERPITSATHMRYAQQWKFRQSCSKNCAHSPSSVLSTGLWHDITRCGGIRVHVCLSPLRQTNKPHKVAMMISSLTSFPEYPDPSPTPICDGAMQSTTLDSVWCSPRSTKAPPRTPLSWPPWPYLHRPLFDQAVEVKRRSSDWVICGQTGSTTSCPTP